MARYKSLLVGSGFVLILTLMIAVPAHASASDCYKIRDEQMRKACLGKTQGDPYYCYGIGDDDRRNACLADVKGDRSYCYKIRTKDLMNACLATTPR